MDKQWDKSDLISYLYGEIDPKEKVELETALANDADLRRELEELKETKDIFGILPDKEVIVPELDFRENRLTIPRHFPLRTLLAVAASITLLFIIGYATGFSFRVSKGEVALTWNSKVEKSEDLLTRDEMNQIIDDKIRELQSKTNTNLDSRFNGFTKDIDSRFASLGEQNRREIKRLVNQRTENYQEDLNAIAANLREQNLKSIADFIEVANQQQKDDVRKMLVDFSNYLDQQRIEDLNVIDQNLKSLKENSDSKFQETGVILASLINTVNTQTN